MQGISAIHRWLSFPSTRSFVHPNQQESKNYIYRQYFCLFLLSFYLVSFHCFCGLRLFSFSPFCMFSSARVFLSATVSSYKLICFEVSLCLHDVRYQLPWPLFLLPSTTTSLLSAASSYWNQATNAMVELQRERKRQLYRRYLLMSRCS